MTLKRYKNRIEFEDRFLISEYETQTDLWRRRLEEPANRHIIIKNDKARPEGGQIRPGPKGPVIKPKEKNRKN